MKIGRDPSGGSEGDVVGWPLLKVHRRGAPPGYPGTPWYGDSEYRVRVK